MDIVLHQPEIHLNTGNIGRTCVATGCSLHLIEPLGFKLNDKMIKRAGLDYWDRLNLRRYLNYEEYLEQNPGRRVWLATTKGGRPYTEADFSLEDHIMFGKESGGIPMEILRTHPDLCIRIPMLEGERSLNLSNSVAIILYEALRQTGFKDMV